LLKQFYAQRRQRTYSYSEKVTDAKNFNLKVFCEEQYSDT